MPHKAGHVKIGQGGKPYKPKPGVTKKTPKATPKTKSNVTVTKVNQGSKTTTTSSTTKEDKPNVFGLKQKGRDRAKMVSAVAQGLSQVAGHAAGKAAGSYSTTDYSQYWGRDNDDHSANRNPEKEENHGKKKQKNNYS